MLGWELMVVAAVAGIGQGMVVVAYLIFAANATNGVSVKILM